MNSMAIGAIVFVVTFGGVLTGMALRRILPGHHLDDASKDAVRVGIGLIATMSALVLGLVTASAKSAYDGVNAALGQSAAQLVTLDRVLARYGPETDEIRKGLRTTVRGRLDAVWPTESGKALSPDPLKAGVAQRTEKLADAIRELVPRDEIQRGLQARAIDMAETLLQQRWMSLSDGGTGVPVPFLVMLVFWLAVTFASFGIFAPANGTVLTMFFVCAVSVASAIFLVLEMETPFGGMLKVSPGPLHRAYESLGQ